MQKLNQDIVRMIDNLLSVGINMAAEKDYNKLLCKILSGSRSITDADAGTLYLLKDNSLHFEFMQNDSLDIDKKGHNDEIQLPPVSLDKKNVAGFCAITGKVIRINDVYENNSFDFSGPRRYDSMTGYETRSMLVAPMIDHRDEVIGVIQLINALDEDGNVTTFPKFQKKVIASLASQAAVAINNARAMEDNEKLLHGMVESMALAIDASSPYDQSHHRRVAYMTENFIEVVNKNSLGAAGKISFSEEESEALLMSAWLHDAGKLALPRQIKAKSTRLGRKYNTVRQRFDLLERMLEDRLNHQDYDKKTVEEKREFLDQAWKRIEKANSAETIMTEELRDQLDEIYEYPLDEDEIAEDSISLLEKSELEALKSWGGPLTPEEQEQWEKHPLLSEEILQPIPFPARLQQVPELVACHHECLDGSGYPRGLKGDEIPTGARILNIVDEFDSLVAAVAPYQNARNIEEALQALRVMRDSDKLDGNLLEIFCRFKVWEGLDFSGEIDYKI